MKRVVFIVLMSIILIPSGIARVLIAEGNTFTKFGNYKIETADNPFVLDGKEHITYLITYENIGFTIKLVADKMKDGTRLLVVSDALSVQYDSHQNHFGVEKTDQKYSAAGLSTSDAALNRCEYFHQKVITSWEVNDLDKIKLVAAYYPALLNNMENLLTAK
jgi:hypothetical protein